MIQWKELTYQTIKCSLKKKKGGNIKSFDIFDIDRYIYISTIPVLPVEIVDRFGLIGSPSGHGNSTIELGPI